MRRQSLKVAALVVSVLSLAGCSSYHAGHHGHHGFKSAALDPFAGQGSPYYKGKKIPFGGGQYQVGNPYQVAGRWYAPHEQPGYEKSGTASWYGEAFHRRRTSNGEWFDMNTLTAAHATLPLPSYAIVTNLENDRQVIVRVNDRGPFVGTRVIDLSKQAADVLGYRSKGTAHVHVKLLGPAPTDDSMAHMVAMNDALNNGASMRQIAAMTNDPTAGAPTTELASADLPDAPEVAQPLQKAAFTPPPRALEASAFIVRVAVFHSLEEASAAYEQVQSFGPTQILKGVGVNGPLYRVQIGPLDNQQDAEAALQTALGSGFSDARIVETQPLRISMK